MDLEHRVVVVTGAGAGIGAAIADTCAEYGAHVVGLDCNPETLDATARRIAASRRSFHGIRTDVSSEQSVAKAFEEIISNYGTIDVLVNNVGVEFYKDFVHMRTP